MATFGYGRRRAMTAMLSSMVQALQVAEVNRRTVVRVGTGINPGGASEIILLVYPASVCSSEQTTTRRVGSHTVVRLCDHTKLSSGNRLKAKEPGAGRPASYGRD